MFILLGGEPKATTKRLSGLGVSLAVASHVAVEVFLGVIGDFLPVEGEGAVDKEEGLLAHMVQSWWWKSSVICFVVFVQAILRF